MSPSGRLTDRCTALSIVGKGIEGFSKKPKEKWYRSGAVLHVGKCFVWKAKKIAVNIAITHAAIIITIPTERPRRSPLKSNARYVKKYFSADKMRAHKNIAAPNAAKKIIVLKPTIKNIKYCGYALFVVWILR
jgi:hypothetical protein